MKQFRIVTYVVFIFVVFSCTGPDKGNKQSDPYKAYDTYETIEFSIKYPNNWRLDTSGYMGTEFSIFSKQTSLLDKFIENVNLIINEVPDTLMDLSAYIEVTEEKNKAIAIGNVLLESERLSANGMEYHKIVYTQQQSIYILKFQQYYWLRNGKAYVLTLACKENEYRTYKERGDLIMNSFVLK